MIPRELIDGWLEDELDAERIGELERRLSEPSTADELVRAAHFRQVLQRLVSGSSGSSTTAMVSARSSRRAPRVRRLTRPNQLRWQGLLAAGLAASVVLIIGINSLPDRPDMPSVGGRRVSLGDRIQSADKPTTLTWTDGTTLTAQPGAAVRVDAGKGKRLAVERGVIDAAVAPQPVDAPFVIRADQSEASTRDARFQMSQSEVALAVTVDRGTVLMRSGSEDPQAITAPGRGTFPVRGRAHLDAGVVQSVLLSTVDGPLLYEVQCGPHDEMLLQAEAGPSGARVPRVTGLFTGELPFSWVMLATTPPHAPWDLTHAEGIEFWYRGPGHGRIWVELLCEHNLKPDPMKGAYHYLTTVSDEVAGWRLVRLRWSDFKSRTDWEGQDLTLPPRLDRILRVNIMQLGDKLPDFAIDRMAAWGMRP